MNKFKIIGGKNIKQNQMKFKEENLIPLEERLKKVLRQQPNSVGTKWNTLKTSEHEIFNNISDNLMKFNEEILFKGINDDTVPGGEFTNIYSPIFENKDGEKFMFFFTQQKNEENGELIYREISLLEYHHDVTDDPRPYRRVTIKTNNVWDRVTFASWEHTKPSDWWYLKKLWKFLLISGGELDISRL